MIEEPGTERPFLPQVIDIAHRRKWTIILPFLLGACGTVYLCVALPPVYRSETTILVEPQEVPEEYVESTVTGSVIDRLNTISQQILSRTRLESVIREFGLYADLRERFPMEVAVNKMREDIEIQIQEGDSKRRRAGKASAVAFTLAYQGRDPSVVQQVTARLAGLYIEENLRIREALAQGTREFLERQLEDMEQELRAREARIREFKQKYMGELPEQLEANLRALDQLQWQRSSLLNALGEALASGGGPPESDPDVQLEAKRQLLASLTARYTDRYPDVIRLKKEIRELEEKLAQDSAEPSENDTSGLDGNRPTVRRLREEIAFVTQRMHEIQRRVENTPKREQELMSLTRDYETIKTNYDSLMERMLNAKIAEDLEIRQKSERFRVLDPANRPERPVKPNRRKILLLGLMLSLGLGGGLAMLRETLDDSFHSVEDVKASCDLPVLGVIPLTVPPAVARRRRILRWTAASVGVGSIAAGLLAVHTYVKDIDVLVADFVRLFQ